MTQHSIVHVEIPATDQQASASFYSQLFGWQAQPWPEMSYTTFTAGEGPGGGFPTADGQLYQPGRVLVYVGTDDIGASLAKAVELGATVLQPETEIPDMGAFAVFADPDGNPIALYRDNGS